MRISLNAIIALLLIFQTAFSQENPLVPEAGGYVQYGMTFHDVDFGTLPGVPGCCPNYEDGTGNAISIGGLYIFPLSGVFSLQGRLGYSYFSGKFNKLEYIGNTYDKDFNVVNVYSRHDLETWFHNLDILPMASIKPFKMPLSFNLGIKSQIILSGSYNQKEHIAEPADALYLGDLKVRNPSNGSINDMSRLQLTAFSSISYKIKLNNKYYIYPEAGYSRSFTNILSDNSWKANYLFAGLLLTMEFNKPEAPEPAITVYEPPVLKATITAKAENFNNLANDSIFIHNDEYISASLFPLLPYIFFNENSSDLPARYKNLDKDEANNFSLNNYFNNYDLMSVYYHLLDIIGSRMNKYQDSKLTLTGCNSDALEEKGNIALSENRAKEIRDYLINVWDINENKINIKSRNLPSQPTLGDENVYAEENRRVEISSNDSRILEPVFIYDTTKAAHPPKLRFISSISSGLPLKKWQLKIDIVGDNGLSILKTFSGEGRPPEELLVDMPSEINKDLSPPYKLAFNLEVSNVKDSTVDNSGSMPVSFTKEEHFKKNLEGDKEVSDYWLIMFDFNDISLLSMNRDIMDIVCKNSTSESNIAITGFTDLLGLEKHNQTLSEKRAISVKEALPCKVKSVEAQGSGEREIYDNRVPEGRFYNRTVHLRVETPVLIKLP